MIAEIIIGVVTVVATAGAGYVFGRKKNDSEIKKNDADTEKSKVETLKLETENKLAQVDLFDRLNSTLTEQNEKLLKSNSVLIDQNRKLLKYVRSLEERVAALEDGLNKGVAKQCLLAPDCNNHTPLEK